jgi:hypothetical protein
MQISRADNTGLQALASSQSLAVGEPNPNKGKLANVVSLGLPGVPNGPIRGNFDLKATAVDFESTANRSAELTFTTADGDSVTISYEGQRDVSIQRGWARGEDGVTNGRNVDVNATHSVTVSVSSGSGTTDTPAPTEESVETAPDAEGTEAAAASSSTEEPVEPAGQPTVTGSYSSTIDYTRNAVRVFA